MNVFTATKHDLTVALSEDLSVNNNYDLQPVVNLRSIDPIIANCFSYVQSLFYFNNL